MDSNDIMSSLNSLLGGSDAQNKLEGIANMFSSGNSNKERKEDNFSEEMFSYMSKMMQSFNRHDNRIDLLYSIRPYLREKRAGNVDMAIRIIRLMNIARDFNLKDVKNVSDV